MIKFLFFDYREVETVKGFERRLEKAKKHPANPLLIADQPWEGGNFTMYGSVVKAEGRPFQCWYTVVQKPWRMFLCYLESDDGIAWRRPLFDICKHEDKPTNIVLAGEPHGAAVIYDEQETNPDLRYKLVAGVEPSHCISVFASPDGIRWTPLNRYPVINTNPDCPMGFLRAPDGRYVVYHRKFGLGRRVCRSDSWNFRVWTGEPRMVFEPDAGDPPQIQFYGMGAAAYGTYELGSLWMYHTDLTDPGGGKMRGYQEVELAYSRSGYAWHRAFQGAPIIPHGRKGSWEQGNLQCSSQPVFLENEIRYYYGATDMFHKTHWELDPQRAGLGLATMKPDRFIALAAGETTAQLTTFAFRAVSPDVVVNADCGRQGWVEVEALDIEFKPLAGVNNRGERRITGDSLQHKVAWADPSKAAGMVGQTVRFRVRVRDARLYSVSMLDPGEKPVYHRFRAPRP